MIQCSLRQLEVRCRQRGYTLDEVRACIVSEDGDTITVDVDHPAYPRHLKPGFQPPREPPPPTQIKTGAGTELKKLLGKIGIKASSSCSCNKRAITMDNNGIEWCENNIDTIVGWLKEEATKRKLPFIDMAGRILVKRAINNAKKNA
jgi:hypothetical protein